MKKYIVNGKSIKAKSVLDAVKKVKDESKTKYWFCPDDNYGQHGTDYFELMLTEKEAAEIKKTRIYNGQKGFLTNSLTAMSYYVNDSNKVKDGNLLVRIVNRNGKLIETKRFPNREKLDNYVNSLENFYDMTKEKELYKNKYNEPDVQDVWTVVVNDSKKVKDAWLNEETKNFFTGGDKPNFDKARKLSKSIGEFWMARSSGVFLGERSQLDKLEKLLRENNIPFKRLEPPKLIIEDSKTCEDMPYNGTSQVKEINKGYAIVLRSRWEKYGVNSGIETWEPSLDGARAHKDSLTRADGLAFVIIDCNTKRVIDSKCKDESSEELVKRYQKRVDSEIESFGRIGGALYDELDDNGLYVKEENGKYIVKKKVQDSVKDESMFMILNKDEGAYLYNVDISAAQYRLTNNANKADKFTLNEANRIINILKKYNFDNLTTSEFLDSKCKDDNYSAELDKLIRKIQERFKGIHLSGWGHSENNAHIWLDDYQNYSWDAGYVSRFLRELGYNAVPEDSRKIKFTLKNSIKDVNPNEGESKEDFIARFMSETKEEYPDEKQRYAVANSYWERRNK